MNISDAIIQNISSTNANGIRCLIEFVKYLKFTSQRLFIFTYSIPADQLELIDPFSRAFRYLQFTKFYKANDHKQFINFKDRFLTLLYDCLEINLATSFEFLDDKLQLTLTVIQALKVFYENGIILLNIDGVFVFKEKGSHQNHVLSLIS